MKYQRTARDSEQGSGFRVRGSGFGSGCRVQGSDGTARLALGSRAGRLGWLLVLVSVLAVGPAARAEILEQILVKVNGEIFTKTDLEKRQVQAIRERGENIDLNSAQGNAQLKRQLDQITPAIMVEVVNEMVVVQRGKELGYTMTDEQFKGVIDDIRKKNNIESDEQWNTALKQENLTVADLRAQIERQMIISRVEQNEVFGKIGVTEEEARAYYDSHASEFTSPPSVTLREILVAVQSDNRTLNVAADEAARQKITTLRARALAGEDLEKLASEASDAASRTNGGLIGPIALADISAELRKMVDGMKVGDITPILRTPQGYQILQLASKTETDVLPFDQARQQISERVFTDKRQAEFAKYLEKLRSEAFIEWKNAEIKKAFDEGLEAQAKGLAPGPAL
jgi:peptidyl-prolyl cis-trans isomerase SurA